MWLPTQSAANHMARMGKDPNEGVAVVRDGKVVSELETVFSLIKDHKAVLGTAHISPKEAFIVVEAAKAPLTYEIFNAGEKEYETNGSMIV